MPANKKSDKTFETARRLLSLGYSDRKVRSLMGGLVSKTWVTFLRKAEGIPANYRKNLRPEVLSDGRIVCKTCKTPKNKSKFNKNPEQFLGIHYSCRDCITKKNNARFNGDLRSYFSIRLSNHRAACVKKKVDLHLDVEWLLEQFNAQNGKCFYTDTPMTHERGAGKHPNVVSLDRIQPHLPYTKDNVVLCTQRVNTMKGDATLEELKLWMPDWHARLEKAGKLYSPAPSR